MKLVGAAVALVVALLLGAWSFVVGIDAANAREDSDSSAECLALLPTHPALPGEKPYPHLARVCDGVTTGAVAEGRVHFPLAWSCTNLVADEEGVSPRWSHTFCTTVLPLQSWDEHGPPVGLVAARWVALALALGLIFLAGAAVRKVLVVAEAQGKSSPTA